MKQKELIFQVETLKEVLLSILYNFAENHGTIFIQFQESDGGIIDCNNSYNYNGVDFNICASITNKIKSKFMLPCKVLASRSIDREDEKDTGWIDFVLFIEKPKIQKP